MGGPGSRDRLQVPCRGGGGEQVGRGPVSGWAGCVWGTESAPRGQGPSQGRQRRRAEEKALPADFSLSPGALRLRAASALHPCVRAAKL